MATFDMIPYGKASTSENDQGKTVITCQHGETECTGNQLHNCGINYLGTYGQAAKMNWVICVTTEASNQDRSWGTLTNWLQSGKNCVDLLDLSAAAKTQVKNDLQECTGQ